MGDEGHRADSRRQPLAAHVDFERGACGGMRRFHDGHRDRMTEAGRESAAGNGADLGVAGVDLGALARGQTSFEREADALARGALREFTPDTIRAGEAAFTAATL